MNLFKSLLRLADELRRGADRLETALTPAKLHRELASIITTIDELACLLRRIKGERQMNTKKKLDQCEAKLREVALDLCEPQDGASLEHQAKKLQKVADDIGQVNSEVHGGGTGGNAPEASSNVHGGGTGND